MTETPTQPPDVEGVKTRLRAMAAEVQVMPSSLYRDALAVIEALEHALAGLAEELTYVVYAALAGLRARDEEIARLKAQLANARELAKELNDGCCIYCNQDACRCPTQP